MSRAPHAFQENEDYVVEDCGHRTPCWVWRRSYNGAGYGQEGPGRVPAYRLYFQRYVGPIPCGLHIDHLCRNRACVNPEHLEAVTPRVNALRGNIGRGVVLSDDDVRAIRVDARPRLVIAEEYGIDERHVRDVKSRRRRASVPDVVAVPDGGESAVELTEAAA